MARQVPARRRSAAARSRCCQASGQRPCDRRAGVGYDSFGRSDLDQGVADRGFQIAAVHDQFTLELEHMGRFLRHVLEIFIPATTHHVPVEERALRRIDEVLTEGILTDPEVFRIHGASE